MRRIQFPALVQPELGRLRYRRIVLGVALVAFGCYSLFRIAEGTQSSLSENAEGIASQLIGALVYLYVLWKVYSQPGRWGFGIGILLTAGCALGILIGGVLAGVLPELAKMQPDFALAMQEGRSLSEWLITALRAVVTLAITAAFLSLRWLYPKVPPPLSPPPLAVAPLTSS
jgi:hypothetical protein